MQPARPSGSLDPIAQLLAGTYPDPQTGELLVSDARAVVIEDSLAGREVELVAAMSVGPRLVVVSDRNTHAALGARVERALASKYTVQSLVLDAPHADTATVASLEAAIDPGIDAIITVGSGTLNDLCKLAALAREIPHLVFATAPSMNGYTSVSASILTDGVKRSWRARTPSAVFFDLAVIAAAPLPLIRAGLGDSVARATAQADWLLSHMLLQRPYREAPFAMLTVDEAVLLSDPRALTAGDLVAIRSLVRTLVLSGFGMTLCGGSFPASQGEHLLGHYLELIHPLDVLHGAQIGVCTLAMAALQARWLAQPTPPVLRASTLERDDFLRIYGTEVGAANWTEYAGKRLDAARAEELSDLLATNWSTMRARIDLVTLGAARTRAVLQAAGCPTTPAELGYTDEHFARALTHAREIRDRYTFLDLQADAI